MLLYIIWVLILPYYLLFDSPLFLFDFHSYFGMGENGSILKKHKKTKYFILFLI